MRKTNKVKIVFQVELPDRSVGIMSEEFAAWTETSDAWCNLESFDDNDVKKCVFVWDSNETGDKCKRPVDAAVVEGALFGFATGYYQAEEEACPDDGKDGT